ncbi:hypothetical protein DL96DRAFT_1580944 [Flagelloscypha sp. PMI_526]|nr:hypothetical protein DL96DRAFT_1580944 [Flagelloscypha sp. PMI_526]
MMVHLSASILAFLTLTGTSLAVPSLPSNALLPRDSHKIAFDDVSKRLLAFDIKGRSLGSFPMTAGFGKRAGTCTPMTNNDIAKIPGLQKLRDEADKNWGNRGRNEVVNDPDAPDAPANVCADDAGVTMVYDGTPACKDIINQASGTLEGGKITLENNEGVNMATTTEVTQAASFGLDTKISVGFSFPEIADVSTEITAHSDFTNTQGTSNSVGADMRTLQRIEQPVDEGQTNCKVMLTTKSCSITGKGSLKMIATGIFWFEYKDIVDGHRKWGLSMDSVLPNVDDRATVMQFKATGNIDSAGHFASSGCTNGTTIVTKV